MENNYYVVEFIKGSLKDSRYKINIKEEGDKLGLIGPFEKIIAKDISKEEAERLCGER